MTAPIISRKPTSSDKNSQSNSNFWRVPRLTGESYHVVLQRLHLLLKPKNYFEIGVNTGVTLGLSTCCTIGVDPEPVISNGVMNNKPACHFFRSTSDDFFRAHNPRQIFDGDIELAFLDGLHLFEFLLRDFINTEKHCRQNSIICLHDCIPTDAFIARRDRSDTSQQDLCADPDWWAGDVWKTVHILKKLRPELVVYAFNAPPTGLILVTNLDNQSSVLEESYFDAVRDYGSLPIIDHGDQYIDDLRMLDTKITSSFNQLAKLVWL